MEQKSQAVAWFLLCSSLSFALSMAVLVSCSNNTTSGQFLFSLDPSQLASDLLTNAYGADSALYPVNSSNLLRDAFLMELPKYYVGLSGVCRTSNSTGQKTCHHNFPQSVDLLRLLSSDITDTQQQAAWSSLLSLGSSMENNHHLISRLTKASGSLLIISAFINLVTLVVALASLVVAFIYGLKKDFLTLCVVSDYIDALFILGPEVMWTYMFMNVMTGPGKSTGMGPGLILLWMAFVAKILADLRIAKFAMEALYKGCRSRTMSNTERRIGQCLEDCECCIAMQSIRTLDDCLRW